MPPRQAKTVMTMKMDVTELEINAVEEIASKLEKFGAIVELRNAGGRIQLIC